MDRSKWEYKILEEVSEAQFAAKQQKFKEFYVLYSKSVTMVTKFRIQKSKPDAWNFKNPVYRAARNPLHCNGNCFIVESLSDTFTC